MWFKENVKEACYLPLVAIESVVNIAESSTGILATALCCLPIIGNNWKLKLYADSHSGSGDKALSKLYTQVAKVLHPALIEAPLKETHSFTFAKQLRKPIQSYIDTLYQSQVPPTMLQKHVFCRGAYASILVVNTIGTVADVALGLVAAIFSLVTLCKFERVHAFAMTRLETNLFSCISRSMKGIIEPMKYRQLPMQRYPVRLTEKGADYSQVDINFNSVRAKIPAFDHLSDTDLKKILFIPLKPTFRIPEEWKYQEAVFNFNEIRRCFPDLKGFDDADIKLNLQLP